MSRLYILALACFPTSALAVPIGFDAFGTTAVFESFAALSPGLNIGIYRPGSGVLVPGTNGPFTFDSGVVLVHPVPNPIPGENEDEIGTAGVNDFRIGPASFGLDGPSIDDTSDVPFGTAFMGLDGSGDNAVAKFSFPSDVLRVGAFVTGSESESEITIFDKSDLELERHAIPKVSVADWSSNFIGLENLGGIRHVVFRGEFLVIDGLTFVPVPEPSSASLVAISLVGIALQSLRGRQKLSQLTQTAAAMR